MALMPSSPRRLALATFAIGGLLIGIFAAAVVPFSWSLREKIRQAMIERDAAVLHPVAQLQLAEADTGTREKPVSPDELITAALKSARQQGMLAVVVFDGQAEMLEAVPDSLILPEIAAGDYLKLIGGARVSRFHPRFQLDRHFKNIAAAERETPVLEVLLPLQGPNSPEILGFAQYLIDARLLARELAALDQRIERQTWGTLGIGAALIALLGAIAFVGLRRAHRQIAERSERLARANFELTLAAKASALGQITSHLIHGLQGPVAGLRAVVAGRQVANAESDWQTAADYTKRLEELIRETVDLLSDIRAEATYEITGAELIDSLRERNASALPRAAVTFATDPGVAIDSHRGSLLCLIATNLIQNAAQATGPGGEVRVALIATPENLQLTVTDNGPGVPDAMRTRLFEPGQSGKPNGTGLGLAISRLLARQIDATLALESTGPKGTTFRLTVPKTGNLSG
jgi:signal transduction histidine kinase